MIKLLILAADFNLLLPISGSVVVFFILLFLSHRYKWRNKFNNFLYRISK